MNVARGSSVTIRSIMEEFLRLSESDVEFDVDPALVRPDDPPDIHGDSSMLADLTGWKPERELSQTLADVWANAEPPVIPPRP